MIKTLIIADDSTGANASAILLNDLNFSSLSLIEYDHALMIRGYDCVAVSTDSRAIDENEAYERVVNTLNTFKKIIPTVLNKRIDSTLRGNIGSELNAFKDLLPDRKIAIVPSFPSSLRTCKDGLVYVDGTLLENTDVARDPKMPLTTSDASEIVLKQFKGSVTNIQLETVRSDDLLKAIKQAYSEFDAIIFDAVTNKDIELISKALVDFKEKIITVDPGPLTYHYTKATLKKSERLNIKRYIYLVGSVTDTTFSQINHIKDDSMFDILPVDAKGLIDLETNDIASNLVKKINQSQKPFILISTTDPKNREVLNLFDEAKKKDETVDTLSKRINNQLALILDHVIEHTKNIGGVFSSGGDVTLSFLNKTSADGIHLLKQVMPLCVYGKVVGGKYDGLPIMTKGGMIGDNLAYETIKEFFLEVDDYE